MTKGAGVDVRSEMGMGCVRGGIRTTEAKPDCAERRDALPLKRRHSLVADLLHSLHLVSLKPFFTVELCISEGQRVQFCIVDKYTSRKNGGVDIH